MYSASTVRSLSMLYILYTIHIAYGVCNTARATLSTNHEKQDSSYGARARALTKPPRPSERILSCNPIPVGSSNVPATPCVHVRRYYLQIYLDLDGVHPAVKLIKVLSHHDISHTLDLALHQFRPYLSHIVHVIITSIQPSA
ncbi:hypothetical protein DFH27DRAFT_598265 [Peziza echinospora]|nr:hypothetical protein DFH27DRAFT_598265 [Peziza echinospora]